MVIARSMSDDGGGESSIGRGGKGAESMRGVGAADGS